MDGENEWEARGSRGTTRDDKNQLNPGGLEENKMRAFSTVTIKKTEIRNDKWQWIESFDCFRNIPFKSDET